MKHVSILGNYETIYSNAVQFIPVDQFQAFELKIEEKKREAGVDISSRHYKSYYNKMRAGKTQ